MHSRDGTRWTEASEASLLARPSDIAWSGTRYVTVGVGPIGHSPDGDRWTLASDGGQGYLNGVGWSGTRLVAVSGATILHSPDGDRWVTANESATSVDLHGVAGNGTHFVAVGDNGTVVVSP